MSLNTKLKQPQGTATILTGRPDGQHVDAMIGQDVRLGQHPDFVGNVYD